MMTLDKKKAHKNTEYDDDQYKNYSVCNCVLCLTTMAIAIQRENEK